MATVTKSSLTANRAGTFSHSTTSTTTEFTCASDEYAIVNVTDLRIVSTATSSANVSISGVPILQVAVSGASSATLIQGTAISATTSFTHICQQVYVGPGQTFQSVIGGNVTTGTQITGSYVVFKNS